jgi:hypothetical protein
MPGAGRDPWPASNKKSWRRVTTGTAGSSRHSLRDGFNGVLRALPGDRAFLPPSPCETCFARLDTSVGVSGPHDFSVRAGLVRLTRPSRPPHPASRFVTIGRNAPQHRSGMAVMMLLICGIWQWRSPATNWHDGQFTHGAHARNARRAKVPAGARFASGAVNRREHEVTALLGCSMKGRARRRASRAAWLHRLRCDAQLITRMHLRAPRGLNTLADRVEGFGHPANAGSVRRSSRGRQSAPGAHPGWDERRRVGARARGPSAVWTDAPWRHPQERRERSASPGREPNASQLLPSDHGRSAPPARSPNAWPVLDHRQSRLCCKGAADIERAAFSPGLDLRVRTRVSRF